MRRIVTHGFPGREMIAKLGDAMSDGRPADIRLVINGRIVAEGNCDDVTFADGAIVFLVEDDRPPPTSVPGPGR